jgi:hypothetical protein
MKRSEMEDKLYRLMTQVMSAGSAHALAKTTLKMLEAEGMLPPKIEVLENINGVAAFEQKNKWEAE